MSPVVAEQIRYFISTLRQDWDTSRDLYQEAEVAIWEAATQRATEDCHAYLIKTGIGAIRHWLRDRSRLIRIPGYLQESGQTATYAKTIVPLDDVSEHLGTDFEHEDLDRIRLDDQRSMVEQLLPRLTLAERNVMQLLLRGRSIREIARQRQVEEGCIYAQQSRAVRKLRRLLKVRATWPVAGSLRSATSRGREK
jgi:RNA polymerase sigma factor (sigma-70 family)